MSLDFSALRKYMMASSIAYIVFISHVNSCLGFLLVERFKAVLGVNIPQITGEMSRLN
jgi:hypothetical protein